LSSASSASNFGIASAALPGLERVDRIVELLRRRCKRIESMSFHLVSDSAPLSVPRTPM
jgi:hypothetical protein